MSDLLIRDADVLKSDIERLAKRSGQTLSQTAREALRMGVDALQRRIDQVDAMPPGDKLRAIAGNVFDADEEYEEFQKILEEIRQGPDRPLPEFK